LTSAQAKAATDQSQESADLSQAPVNVRGTDHSDHHHSDHHHSDHHHDDTGFVCSSSDTDRSGADERQHMPDGVDHGFERSAEGCIGQHRR